MKKLISRGMMVVPCMLLFSCSLSPSPALIRQDPLIGKIVSPDTAADVSFEKMTDTLASADIIYLSEKHDNPEHHRIQHAVIEAMIQKGLEPFLAFEFFAMADTPLLMNFLDTLNSPHPPETEKKMVQMLRQKLGWERQPDKMWNYYFDLLKLARDNNLKAAGIDLTKTQTRRITRKGLSGLTGIEQRELFSTGLCNPAYEEYMHRIFKKVHCGMDSRTMQSRLWDSWVARNDRMALSLCRIHDSHEGGPVVVIIGGGHTEYNLGVPDRVHAINPDIRQVNVGLVEITVEQTPAELYFKPLDLEGFEPRPPFDFIWFTQRVSYEDPCDRFKSSLEKMKNRPKKKGI